MMIGLNETKVSIDELISMANYSIEETTVPPYNQIVEDFSDTWKDLYLDEGLKEQEGKHCFIIWDDCCPESIRAIVVEEELNKNAKMSILDIMDNVIFDLIYYDAVEQAMGGEGYSQVFDESYTKLLQYIKEHDCPNVSDYKYSWLLVLADYRLDLITL